MIKLYSKATPDTERKILRIYVNESLHGRSPTLERLRTYTGKSENDLKDVVRSLIEKGHLGVKNGEMVKILQNPVEF
ncbi:hypothetical protein [Scopulibacillus darangshiensis]|uniref:hypothetical protein n=1 Tax=Scopulibacillus darangshiensis TaxID=442528 RepID=UPI001FB4AE20|nr:hypothetical protein [Scopulibacillus darangshiensis]